MGHGHGGRTRFSSAGRARFQPLLLAGAFVVVLPTLVVSDHPARPVLLVLGVLFAATGLGAWWWGRRAPRPAAARDRVAFALVGFAVPSFLALVVVLGRDDPEPFLPLGAALLCAMAPVERTSVRLTVQGLTVAVYASLLALAGREPPDVLLPVALLVGVAALSSALARDLVRIRRAERAARRDAQRRAELLTAVRALPGSSLEEGAAAACTAMRTLGFDAAGCAVLRADDRLHELHLDGLPVLDAPLARGQGLAGTCLAEGRTLVVGDYQADARRLDARPEVGAAVVVPVRVDGEVVGTLMGVRRSRSEPTPAEVEVAEVLAAHLGAVFATERAVRRQRELLARMEQLETMRSSFVAQVSDELRDPLTVVRGVAGTLAMHGQELEAARRNPLFGDMADQTDQLRRTIDALLDFSRFQSTRPDAVIQPVPLQELLDPLVLAIDADLVPGGWSSSTVVLVDAGLVRHAVELLVAGTGVVEAAPQLDVAGSAGVVELTVRADSEASAAPALVRSLAAQLLIAAGAELDGHAAAPVVRLPVVGAAVTT